VIELKVRKFGNSLGVVLPKEVIARLHTRNGLRLFLIEAPYGNYRLTPYGPRFEKKVAKAEQIMARYRYTLHTLGGRIRRAEQARHSYFSCRGSE
jgi:antitoxin component of MazEF toxin-antitoxin module